MLDALRRTLTLQGRISRLGYWRWQLSLNLVGVAIWIAMVFFAMGGVTWAAFGLLALLAAVAYAAVGVVVRRLHDRGKSGWWLLLFQGAPMLCGAVPMILDTQAEPDAAAVFMVVGLVTVLIGLCVTIWGFIEIGLRRGQPGDNRFGPQP